jgi:hypothetical protein
MTEFEIVSHPISIARCPLGMVGASKKRSWIFRNSNAGPLATGVMESI